MSFSPQPNAWQCGPFALRHALLALGIVADERVITRASGATEAGADERDLGRAAARFGCALGCERFHDADATRRALAEHLRVPQPVLLCVDGWEHWLTVVGMEVDLVVVLDSRTSAVWQLVPWSRLAPRIAYAAGRGRRWYDLHPLVPTTARTWPARFSLARAEALREPEGRDLSNAWGQHLAGLTPLSVVPGPQTEWTVPVGDLLRARSSALLGALPTRGALAAHRRLTQAAFVADTHALEILMDRAPALETFATRLTRNAAA